MSILFISSAFAADTPYICGSDRITGQLTTSDPLNTSVMITIKRDGQEIQNMQAVIDVDGSYTATFDDEKLADATYTIESVATLS